MGFLSSLIPFGNMNNLSKLVPVISFITLFIFVDIIVYFNMGWKKKAAEMMSEKSVSSSIHKYQGLETLHSHSLLSQRQTGGLSTKHKPMMYHNSSIWDRTASNPLTTAIRTMGWDFSRRCRNVWSVTFFNRLTNFLFYSSVTHSGQLSASSKLTFWLYCLLVWELIWRWHFSSGNNFQFYNFLTLLGLSQNRFPWKTINGKDSHERVVSKIVKCVKFKT